MNWKEKIKLAWENKGDILEGFYNTYISHDPEIKAEAARRLSICEANTCGYWDSTGTSEKLVMKGEPGCTGCGCNGKMKTSAMNLQCYLGDIGQTPLWEAVTTQEMEKAVGDIRYNNQFKQK